MSVVRYLIAVSLSLVVIWVIRFTHLVLKWHVLRGRRIHYIHVLHQKYGSVVRTAPHEADFSDLDSFRTIHKIGSGFTKSPWYQSFRDQPAKDLFTFLDPKAHAQRRRLMARPFSNSELRKNWERTVRDLARQTVLKIRDESAKGTADVYKWWTLMAYDIITKIAFGESSGLVESGKKSRVIIDLESLTALGGIRSEMRWLFDTILSLPIPAFHKYRENAERVRAQGWKAAENSLAKDLAKSNVFSGIVEQFQHGTDTIRDIDAACEAQGLIIAGSGTTAVTLTYLVWSVLQRPELKQQLATECQELHECFTDHDLEKLEVLNAVINETLRLYGAAPGSLPRIVPPEGVTLGGYAIPGGLTVCTQAFSIHRNPGLFPDPER
ncbi:hypothetical protein AbraIFM66950_012152 [Aspergillus brasiliensis]|nr:hypothetical protein AbraIFM66950_012152 [Aspergillus brasiliensis]